MKQAITVNDMQGKPDNASIHEWFMGPYLNYECA